MEYEVEQDLANEAREAEREIERLTLEAEQRDARAARASEEFDRDPNAERLAEREISAAQARNAWSRVLDATDRVAPILAKAKVDAQRKELVGHRETMRASREQLDASAERVFALLVQFTADLGRELDGAAAAVRGHEEVRKRAVHLESLPDVGEGNVHTSLRLDRLIERVDSATRAADLSSHAIDRTGVLFSLFKSGGFGDAADVKFRVIGNWMK